LRSGTLKSIKIDQMLSTPLFCDLSLDLFSSFWGSYEQSEVWGFLLSRISKDVSYIEERDIISIHILAANILDQFFFNNKTMLTDI